MKDLISDDNKKEIFWNLINSSLLGAAVFFGAFLDGGVSRTDLIAAFGSAAILFLTKFGEYWTSEKPEYSKKKSHFATFL